MDRAMWTAASGMQAQRTRIDTISNDLANANTNGFKQSRATFQDQMYQVERLPGAKSSANGDRVPTGVQIGLGVQTGSVSPNFEQGSLRNTGNDLDMAIEGDGFFRVQLPNGETGYTRAGNFNLNAQGQVVTPDGYALASGVNIPQNATNINISADGTVDVNLPGQNVPATVGQIQLATFVNPAGLRAEGGNIFTQTAASGAPQQSQPGVNGAGTVNQGFVEQSNVSVVDEMTNMIAAQRAYEVNSKAIQTSDQMLQTVNQMKR